MEVLLVDIDSVKPKYKNLALMHISAYHKRKGDNVGFDIGDPDYIYYSCIFKKNRPNVLGRPLLYPNATCYIGGSGISNDWLPKQIQKIYPDYSLYPDMDYSIGFSTRGCIRKCPWCIVPEKEGQFRRWQKIKEFHNPDFKKVMLLDNNILADKEWFFENTDFILENDLKLIEGGMDIRLLDIEIAERLAKLKYGIIHFAFDSMHDEIYVREGIDLLKSAGIDTKNKVSFYVLTGYNTSQDDDKFRCRLLKKLNTGAFVMQYVENEWTKRIARWCNRKALFWSMDIDEYDG